MTNEHIPCYTLTKMDDALESRLAALGVKAGCWPAEAMAQVEGEALLNNPEAAGATLRTISDSLSDFKQRYGYAHEDVVGLHPQTPGLEAMLAKFRPLHHHTDDEVRLILHGEGIFGFVPEAGAEAASPFELSVRAGEWIIIPAYTLHYFYLGPAQTALAVRLFRENPRWEAIYA